MGINCCVISYDQKVSVSIVGDGMAAGDGVAQIMANYDEKFGELLAAARINGEKYAEIRNVLPSEQHAPGEGAVQTPTEKAAVMSSAREPAPSPALRPRSVQKRRRAA
jgi:hypothetical protein